MARPVSALVKLVMTVVYMVQSSRPGARLVRGRLLEIAASATCVQRLGAIWSAERQEQPAFWPIAA